jgi:hypothetical protein
MGRDPGGLPAAADDDDFLEERLMVARPLAFFFPSGFGGAPLSPLRAVEPPSYRRRLRSGLGWEFDEFGVEGRGTMR